MQCSCGGYSEYTREVIRNKEVVATWQKCPVCGRVLITSGEAAIRQLRETEGFKIGDEPSGTAL
jgi:uncharacterized Zn finger protein